MSESNKEDISHFGIKIENMLDELIKSDDELDNNQMRNSLKFSEDNSLSEEEKENAGELFNTDIFSNIFSPTTFYSITNFQATHRLLLLL